MGLAERIDSFLSTQELHGPCPPLARDCRSNLDLLPVLADGCEDAGLTHSAAAARPLHELVQGARRSPLLFAAQRSDEGENDTDME